MIDHIEAFLASRVIDPADVDEADELATGIIAQEAQHIDYVVAIAVQDQLVMGHDIGNPQFLQLGGDMLAKIDQVFIHGFCAWPLAFDRAGSADLLLQ